MDKRLNVSYFKFANVKIGSKDKSIVYNLSNILQSKYYNFDKYRNKIGFDNKTWVPAIQNTNCGWRVNTRDKEYFSKYWGGFIFVDIDHIEDDPDLFLDKLHHELCKYHFYIAAQTSYSKKGFHFIFYIPKKYGTVEEYYRYAAYIYTLIFNSFIPIENYDWHNFQHHQVLKIAPHPWKINSKFNISEVNIQDSDISPFFVAQAKHFIELYYREERDIKRTKLDNKRYSYSYVDDSNLNDKFFYFEHADRWKLFMTLMYIYNQDVKRVYESACKIMKYSKTDKHSYSELCNYFDPDHTNMDWYEKYQPDEEYNTCKLEFLEKYFNIKLTDKYDTKIHMKDDEYLLDYKDLILNSIQPGINTLTVNTGGGKTTFWDTVRKNSIIIEPYGSVINDKYDEEVYKAAGMGKQIDISQDYQVCNYWRFIDFVNYENTFYEYIVVDESHLIGMQSYRNHKANGHTMLDFINALNTYYIQFPETKIVLQTATPSNESYFFNIVNKITFDKDLQKEVNIYYDHILTLNNKNKYVDNIYASVLHLVEKMYSEGRKVYIYWGSGGINIMKAIQKLIAVLKNYSCAIYHKRYEDSYDVNYIRENKRIGKYDVLISSCYFSVGCDLNDEENAGIIIIGNNTFQEDVQVIGRFRVSKDIEVHILPDKICGIKKVDVSQVLTSLQKRIKVENEINELRDDSILTPLCETKDIDAYTYMECSRDYYCDFERKFELYNKIGYKVHNSIKKEFDFESNCWRYDICGDNQETPVITYVDTGYELIKEETKRYYKTNDEIQYELYKKIVNGDRSFKKMRSELNDRPKIQDWVKIIEIFHKHYDLDYILHNFDESSILSITYQKLHELLKWKMKLNKGKYDEVEKILIDNLIYNYDSSKDVAKNIEVWILLYYCVWISNSTKMIEHRYDMDSKKIFYIYNQWSSRIYNILSVTSGIRNYIINYGIKDEDIIFASISDFLKDIYEKQTINEKIETFLNSKIYKSDIKKFLNIKLAKYDKEICSSVHLENNIATIRGKLNVKGCNVTDKFNAKKLEKYKLHIGQYFDSHSTLAEYCNVSLKSITTWISKQWIKDI